ncbi:unnamed protein product [Bursaphelenchus xylophilus]|uniref:(pine wood nematode) hypothetical protein n=1 Tax=Bursaphelenchus xylophilus TaxID=6326 RepID=A0A1I7SC83_BURXY|nr:unnamed protein product [Bursaphelenchus xylophilus]CAG9094576.1 unnamed protein product [Bursaphelenchus xylophilus]
MSRVEDFLEHLCQPIDKLEKKNGTFRKFIAALQYICLLLHVYAQILQYIFIVSYIYYGDYLTAIAPTVCCIAYIITYIGSWRRIRFLLIPNVVADLLVPFFYTYVAIALFVEAGSDQVSRYFAGNTSGELQLTALFLLTCSVSQWLFLFVLYRDYFWIKHNKL